MEYRENVLKNAVFLYGEEKQTEMAIEEMGELLVAINQHKRGRVDVKAVQEEIADVKIMMDQLSMIYGEEEVRYLEKVKLARLQKRIIKQVKKEV